MSGQRSIVAVMRSAPRRRASARRDRFREEYPRMGAIARARPFDRDWDAFCPRRVAERSNILHPGLLVEVGREEPAGLVRQHGIDTGREIRRLSEVFPVRCERRTSSPKGMNAWFGHSPHLTRGFPTDPADPLVPTHRRVARLPALLDSPSGAETRPPVPRKRLRKSESFSAVDDVLVTREAPGDG